MSLFDCLGENNKKVMCYEYDALEIRVFLAKQFIK